MFLFELKIDCGSFFFVLENKCRRSRTSKSVCYFSPSDAGSANVCSGTGDVGSWRQKDRQVIEFAHISKTFARHCVTTDRHAHIRYLHVICETNETGQLLIFDGNSEPTCTVQQMNVLASGPFTFAVLKIAADREGVQ